MDGEFGFGSEDFRLLLRRMQALALAPEEIIRLEGRVFRDMAAACADCTSKPRCARDLGCPRPGEACGAYCPNVAALEAMADLPWFAMTWADDGSCTATNVGVTPLGSAIVTGAANTSIGDQDVHFHRCSPIATL